MLKNALKISTIIAVTCFFAGNSLASDDTAHSGHESHAMTMHHMHIMLNHAVEMAAKGSNLVMIGQMGMAGEIDAISIEEGKGMIEEAKMMIDKVMKGDTMKNMHLDGITGTNDVMAHTHQMGDAALKYIELLESMSSSKHNH